MGLPEKFKPMIIGIQVSVDSIKQTWKLVKLATAVVLSLVKVGIGTNRGKNSRMLVTLVKLQSDVLSVNNVNISKISVQIKIWKNHKAGINQKSYLMHLVQYF